MEITVKVNYKNEKLQKLRQAAGLSQSQLAEAAGVTSECIRNTNRATGI